MSEHIYFDGPNFNVGDTYFFSKWLCPVHDTVVRMRRAIRCKHLVDFCQSYKPRTVCFYRQFALGDVLMLIPIMRLFRRVTGLSTPILLVTGSGVHMQLMAMERTKDFVLRRTAGRRDYGCDVHIDLDSALEADHRGGRESDVHRLDLYAQTLGLQEFR